MVRTGEDRLEQVRIGEDGVVDLVMTKKIWV